MKIIHVVAAITEEASGPSYSVVRLCEELIRLGCEVTLATLDWKPGFSYPSFVKTFPLGFGPRRLGRSPAMKQWIMAQVSQGEIDIIHNHGLWMMPNIYPGVIAKRYNLPYIVSPRGMLLDWAFKHGSRIKRILWPFLQRPALQAVSCFHTTSEDEYLSIRSCSFMQPVAIIPIGIDIPALPPKSPEKGNKILLFLGRIHRIKGLDILLKAWREVESHFPDWTLRIVGPDENGYQKEVSELASTLKIKRIEFSGPLYGKQKWEAYWSADIFVLSTYSENFGIAVAEALAAGTPAIVSKGAPWSILPKIGAGWWIEIGVDPLIAALEQALALPPERLRAMGENGRAWMDRDFSWAGIARQMAAFYAWLLGRGPRPEFVRMD